MKYSPTLSLENCRVKNREYPTTEKSKVFKQGDSQMIISPSERLLRVKEIYGSRGRFRQQPLMLGEHKMILKL